MIRILHKYYIPYSLSRISPRVNNVIVIFNLLFFCSKMTATGASKKPARGSAKVQRNWSSERRYVFIFPSDVEELKKKNAGA
jgi:hypothetical protein